MFAKRRHVSIYIRYEWCNVTGGSACTSGSQKGSHVIEAIDPDNQCAIIRFSFGKNNTREELDYVIETLKNMMVPVPA